MNSAYLLTGGNIGNRQQYLSQAKEMIGERCGFISEVSHLYETAAWGKTDQNSFLNQVIAIDTELPPYGLLLAILSIEQELGRQRTEKYGARTLDIDILLYAELSIHTAELIIPHPELPTRRFALEPLNEIAPALMHPVLRRSIGQLLRDCSDTLTVIRL